MSTANNWLGPAEGSHMVIAGGCGGIGLELVKQALAHKLRVTVLDLPASMKDESSVEGASYIGFVPAMKDRFSWRCKPWASSVSA